MIAMIRKFLNLAGERKKQLYLAWLFQALTSVCEGAIYFTLFLVLRDILNGSFTRESLLRCFNRMLLHEDVMRLVGDFTSLILLTVNVDNDSSFVNHCSAIQKELWEDLEHISVGGVWVERELNKANSGKNQVMMPVVFTSGLGFNTNTDGGPDTFLGEIVEGLSQTPQTWLDHQIMEQNGTVLLTWDYVVELFPDGMIDEMFDTYVHLIDLLCEASIM